MGDVVSIKKSSDDDLLSLFTSVCPVVSEGVDDRVQQAACLALGRSETGYQPSFKAVCIIVAGACLLGAALVKGFTTSWNTAVSSSVAYQAQVELLNTEAMLGAALPASAGSERSWHRSKDAWAEYIAKLERDPFYQHVQQEKMRFDAQYPSSAPDSDQN